MADADYRLLKTQKNEILNIIMDYGLDPIEFEWEELERSQGYPIGEETFHRLIHKPSGYSALFGQNFLSYSPGPESPTETEHRLDWGGKRSAVYRWLTYLKREVEAPDLWASLSQEQALLSLEPAEATNTSFTPDEQRQVKQAIEEIRIYITTTYTLESEPLARINRKLDYLIDASTRLGRIDWKNLFVGALISLALQQLPSSGPGVRELIAAAGHLLRHVLGSVLAPPLLQ
jgi:hypothetical protein